MQGAAELGPESKPEPGLSPGPVHVRVGSDIIVSPRVLQASGMFDVPAAKRSELAWDVSLPLGERDWNIGLIVGPSGSGKSTVARALWPEQLRASGGYEWPADRSILDGFPAAMSIKDIVALLTSVGFSSPPSWVRPFAVLSTGEQFRVTLARLLAETGERARSDEADDNAQHGLAVMDEYTSVVDRTVAQIGSAALAKTVRRRGQHFVAVTCHDDVLDWLQPDWVYQPAAGQFDWRCLRRSGERRPEIVLDIQRVHHSAWRLFAAHHYLSSSLNTSAVCFVAFWRERPVAFNAWLPVISGSLKHAWRSSRTVCLPDYQGVGIGNALNNTLASAWSGCGYRALSTTSHPAMVHSRAKSPKWTMLRAPSRTRDVGGQASFARDSSLRGTRADKRFSAGFEYVGPAMDRETAERLLQRPALVTTQTPRPQIQARPARRSA
jgi:ABC-type Mn2+/Zn2+ transport system ATPase subunit